MGRNICQRGAMNIGYFARNGFWVGSGQLIAMGTGLITSVAWARFASQSIYGQYQYVLAVVGFLSGLSLSGLNLAVMRAVIEGQDAALRRGVSLSFAGSLLAVPLLIGWGGYRWYLSEMAVAQALLAAALIFPFYYAPNTWTSFWEAKKQFGHVARRVMVAQLVTMTGLLSALLFRVNLPWLVLIHLGLPAAMHGYFYWRTQHIIVQTGSELDIPYGLKISLQKFAQNLTATVPLLAVAYFFNYRQVAIFSIAFFLITFVNSLATTLMSIYLPDFISERKDNWVRTWRAIGLAWLLGCLLLAFFWLGLKIFFVPLYSVEYLTSRHLLYWWLPLVLFMPLRGMWGHYLTVRGYNFSLIGQGLVAHVISLIVLVLLLSTKQPFMVSVGWYYATLFVVIVTGMWWLWWKDRSKVEGGQAARQGREEFSH